MAKHVNGKTRRRWGIKARVQKREAAFMTAFRNDAEIAELGDQVLRLGSLRRARDYYMDKWTREALGQGKREMATL
jgi:hypothetical protein